MAGNVELTINGVDATKAAFGSAGARATTLNQKFGELSRRQQGALRREAREVKASERAYSQYRQEQDRTAASARKSAGIRTAVVAAAAYKIGGWLQGTIDLYAKQEAATRSLTAALETQGTYTPQLGAYYQALASDLQRLGTVGDETLLQHQALLVQVGDVGPEDMRRALEAAQDLSIGIGRDLKVAVELVGKAAAGETATLKRYGIVLDEAALEGDKFEAVLGAIEARFGGQMNAYAETHAGKYGAGGECVGRREGVKSEACWPDRSRLSMEEISFGCGRDVQGSCSQESRSWMSTLASWAV